MKKKWTFMLASAAILATGVAPLSAFAGETGDSLNSNGLVQFRPSEDPTKPVDPDNPDPNKPVVPEDETKPWDPKNPIPGTKGPLSIDFASSFDFGVNKISSKDETYFARAQKAYPYKDDGVTIDEANPFYRGTYVQVTDVRGTNAGWTLKVKQNGKFKAMKLNAAGDGYEADTAAHNQTLEGAQISLDQAAVASNATEKGVIGRTGKVTLSDAGTEVTVMSAENGKGAGTWVNQWGTSEVVTEKVLAADKTEKDAQVNVNKAVTLEVPGASGKDATTKYLTTLTWTLTNVPGNTTIQ